MRLQKVFYVKKGALELGYKQKWRVGRPKVRIHVHIYTYNKTMRTFVGILQVPLL